MDHLDRRTFLGRILGAAAGLPFLLSQSKNPLEGSPKAEPKPVDPKPRHTGNFGPITTYTFDSSSNGARTSYCYDASGKVTKIIQADGGVWSYEYGTNGPDA